MAKKKNTARALFEENSGRASSKTDISPVFETDVGVSRDDNGLGLGELFGDIPKTSGVSKELNLLEKLLGGPDPYGAKPSGLGELQVPNVYGDSNTEADTDEAETDVGVTDTDVDGYIETLRSILDPNYGAQVSEDIMGQYAAMTGGRPSSAAISAGTAAKVDAETALLRELLSVDTEDSDGKSVLEKLLREDDTETNATYEEWVAPLLEGKEGLFNDQEVDLLVAHMPTLFKELEAEYPSDYVYRVYYLIQSMLDNGNITERTYNTLLHQTGLDSFLG